MGRVVTAERIADLIGAIYDCALDPALWPATIDAIRRELGFHNAALEVRALPSTEMTLNISVGIEAPWLDKVESYGPDIIALWGGLERIQHYPLYEPIVNSHVVDRATVVSNRYFVEWVAPQDITDAVAIALARDREMIGSFTMGRHAASGSIEEAEVSALRMIAPHFRRAISISKLLDLQTVKCATFAEMLDAFAAAVVFVDAGMKAVHANAAARRMLKEAALLSVHNGVLRFFDQEASSRLQAAVRLATRSEAEIGGRGIGVPARARNGDPAIVHLLPLAKGATRAGLVPTAAAVLFITPSQHQRTAPIDALAALYDLTPAEARVLELVVEARAPIEIGKKLGVAPSTIKTHLQKLFVKTGCNRQADLVRLASSFLRPG